jgi:hypothetical protein
MLAECAASLSGTFGRQEIVSWFRRHYPDVKESTLSAHIQAYTSNATNREGNHPGLAGRTPLFVRVGHGTYQLYQGGGATSAADASDSAPAVVPAEPSGKVPPTAVEEWSWEGNVQASVVTYLAGHGRTVTRVADTAKREQGTDIESVRLGTRLFVEVKGWPSTKYVDPSRASERKPTSPSVMARAWFADGIMHVMRLRSANPEGLVWLALPSRDTYRRLWDGVAAAAQDARLDVVWVDENGSVDIELDVITG